jgi:hypothetical protein
MARNDYTQDANGKDMPGDNPAYDLKKRATETGYGATTQDIDTGYLNVANADTDSRIGVLPMPTTSITESDRPSISIDVGPKGFLPRPSIPIDR